MGLASVAPSAPLAQARSWLVELAGARWTVLFFLLTAAGSLMVAYEVATATALMTVPFVLLTLNLGAAVAVLPRFRRDLPLLVFHLALLALIALFVWSRLTYLDATTALTQGESFEGELIRDDRGLLHGNGIASLRFVNEGFSEHYPNLYRVTENRVRWQDAAGNWHSATIGGNNPLVVGQYRVYTKRQRGYAPLFLWRDTSGAESLGHVQLKNAVEGESPALNEWQLPDGTAVWTMLDQGDQAPANFAPAEERKARTNMDAASLEHRLVLRVGETRHLLQPGDQVELPGGTLTYLQLDAWLGYRIVYDPAQFWILSTIAVGVLSLLWFYSRQLIGRGSWDRDR